MSVDLTVLTLEIPHNRMHDSKLRRFVLYSQDANYVTMSLAERDSLQEEVVRAEPLNYFS
jgi:hypothetical protein